MNHIKIETLECKATRMISIIIPVYNAAQTLDDSIKSAINQKYENIEIILVDDGSKDNSGELCKKWEQSDKRVKTVMKENGGVSSARNAGIVAAQGEFIIMLDSDDKLTPDACLILMEQESKTNADCIIFGVYGDSVTTVCEDVFYGSINAFRKDFLKWLNAGFVSSCCNKFFKKNLIEPIFPENISFGEDLFFSLSYLAECKGILFIKNVLYLYNTSTVESLSRSFRTTKIGDIEYCQKAVLSFTLGNKSVPELYHKYISDVLNYIRELYCCESISYSDKAMILKQWYPQSYLKTIKVTHQYSFFYRCLLFCVRKELWFVPQTVLWIVRTFRKTKNKLIG